MNTYKTCQVIILPVKDYYKLTSDEKSNMISKLESGLGFGYQNGIQQHLYLTSTDKIEDDDWFIENGKYLINSNVCKPIIDRINRKIIATTDKSLTTQDHFYGQVSNMHLVGPKGLPQIPQSFIKTYVKAEGKIDEVNVEMEFRGEEMRGSIDKHLWFIKTRSDNTCIIHQVKSYSRSKVDSLIRKALFEITGEARHKNGINQ